MLLTAAIILILLLSVLLILVVLVQNPKGGLSSQFTGGGASQVMGVQNTNNLLEKLTWGFALGIIVLSLAANSFLKEVPTDEAGFVNDANIEAAQQKANFSAPAATETPAENQELAPAEEASEEVPAE